MDWTVFDENLDKKSLTKKCVDCGIEYEVGLTENWKVRCISCYKEHLEERPCKRCGKMTKRPMNHDFCLECYNKRYQKPMEFDALIENGTLDDLRDVFNRVWLPNVSYHRLVARIRQKVEESLRFKGIDYLCEL